MPSSFGRLDSLKKKTNSRDSILPELLGRRGIGLPSVKQVFIRVLCIILHALSLVDTCV